MRHKGYKVLAFGSGFYIASEETEKEVAVRKPSEGKRKKKRSLFLRAWAKIIQREEKWMGVQG